ncbi:hypothetical protein RFF05_09820 [Bengtsoniella intestinalis]|uniref:CIS tube protein n=1 Tax=Bengtsoniella intestinalis TaxID=3073143 RepID=UPI00391EE2AB
MSILETVVDLAKGSLEKAILTLKNDSGTVTKSVQYNPSTLRILAQAEMNDLSTLDSGSNSGTLYQDLVPAKTYLMVTLVFDSASSSTFYDYNDANSAVSTLIDNQLNTLMSSVDALKLEKVWPTSSVRVRTNALIGAILRDTTRDIIFHWGEQIFEGELINVEANYILFDPKGEPTRSHVNLTLAQKISGTDHSNDYKNFYNSTEAQTTNSGASSTVDASLAAVYASASAAQEAMATTDDGAQASLDAAEQTAEAAITEEVAADSTEKNYDYYADTYNNFRMACLKISVGGTALSVAITDAKVELGVGYEASVASFTVDDAYDGAVFKLEGSWLYLGAEVSIFMGYGDALKQVFKGHVASYRFHFDGTRPQLTVHCMDAKGLLMASTYARALTSTVEKGYSGAVKEILTNNSLASSVSITATPDIEAFGKSDSAYKELSIESVSESDYDFIVKAAKKFNYEFYVENGKIIFRKAREGAQLVATLGNQRGLIYFDVEYNLLGLVKDVVVKAYDPAKGGDVLTNATTDSQDPNHAKGKEVVSKITKTYVDASVRSVDEAGYRADYLRDQSSFRLGHLSADCVGIPDILPGNNLKIDNLGDYVNNAYYLTEVTHSFSSPSGYRTKVVGKCQTMAVDIGASTT